MAHLIYRCREANRVITTGIEIDPDVFARLHTAHTMPCRFCERDHVWELVEDAPEVFALMSLRAEDFLGRAVQSEAYAERATDPDVREMYARTARQWYQLAVEHEKRADALA